MGKFSHLIGNYRTGTEGKINEQTDLTLLFNAIDVPLSVSDAS